MIRRGLLILFFLLNALGAASSAWGAAEYEVKAAFLYNFTRFVSWPAATPEDKRLPIVIGVLGVSPFGDALEEAVRGKTLDGRPLTVRYSRNLVDLGDVHVLFICRSEADRVPQILTALHGRPVLTVADLPNFTAQGGMVRFFFQERRVAFEINPAAAEYAGLRVSSRLLSVAAIYPKSVSRSR